MHVPDGFLDAQTSVLTGAASVVVVGIALRGARRELDDRTSPLVGLVATFVFAAQMINFPVATGTSGHLLGGALAACLVGPCTAVLCMTVVLTVQSLLFADGGVTAWGTNVLLIGVGTVVVSHLVMRTLTLVLPTRMSLVAPAAALAAALSVPLAALGFVGLYAVGGTVDVSLPALLTGMVGVHVLVGLGEALITFSVVGSVLAARPDLVYAARDALAERQRKHDLVAS